VPSAAKTRTRRCRSRFSRAWRTFSPTYCTFSSIWLLGQPGPQGCEHIGYSAIADAKQPKEEPQRAQTLSIWSRALIPFGIHP
jgi:hypothetical protein